MKNIKDLIVHEKYQKKEKKRNYSSASIKQFKDSLNFSLVYVKTIFSVSLKFKY